MVMAHATLFWPATLGVLGAILGSFIATLVIRWPEGRSVMHGRSACDGCGRTLRPRDLVPLVSAILARGRCRPCGARINPLHARIELAAVAIGVAAGVVTATPLALAGAAFGWVLLALASLDAIAFWLPDRLTIVLALGGVVTALIGIPPAPIDRLVGAAAGAGSLWIVAVLYRRLRGREGMGAGDPKLFGAIGLWLGWQPLPAVLFLASIIGLGFALLLRVRGRAIAADTALPFGTLLAVAAYPAWLVVIGAGA